MMSMDIPITTTPAAPYSPPTAVPLAGDGVEMRALLLRLLEAEERKIRTERKALDERAREIGQMLAALRKG